MYLNLNKKISFLVFFFSLLENKLIVKILQMTIENKLFHETKRCLLMVHSIYPS